MKLIKNNWPILLFILLITVFTYPFWLKGLIPAPLDFLVNFFQPWSLVNSSPVKNPAISDVVNQIIPWKIFTIDQFKSGNIPLWNPYNLAGSPHLANWQSAVFYPLNLLFLLFNWANAWGLFIISQPLLAGIFTYLYCQNLKLSKPASLIASISFAFSGFLTTWFQWGTLGHAILWLPLCLWAIEKFTLTRKTKYLVANTFFLAFSLLAGHLQISLYVIIFSFIYFLFKSNGLSIKEISSRIFYWILPFAIVAFQFFPSIELYLNSARIGSYNPGWYKFFQIPFQYLVTFITPDFFGNPTTRNIWGTGSYVEMMGYISAVSLILALSTIKLFKSKQLVRFYWISTLAALLIGLKIPISNLFLFTRLPVFSSSSPARIIGLICFALSILAAYGFDHAKKNHLKTSLKLLIVLSLLWISTFILIPQEHIVVVRRNLMLPSALVITSVVIFFAVKKKKSLHLIASLALIILISADLFRFHHKFNPYTNKQLLFPSQSITSQLAKLPQPNYTFGLFDANLNLPFNLFSLQGYDPFIFKRYPELISYHKDGTINLDPKTTGVQINKNDKYTIALTSLLNAKYFIQPTVHGSAPWELHLWEYSDQFKLIQEDESYQLFENIKARDHFYLTSDYHVTSSNQEIVNTLFNPQNKSIILENSPPIDIQSNNQSPGEIKLTKFLPNRLEFDLSVNQPALVYINSNYYPGWKAFVDDSKTSIMRANYSFKAIPVSTGARKLILVYQPPSFTIGLSVSTISLAWVAYVLIKKRS